MKLAVGVPAGGRITPGGTDDVGGGFAACALVPTAMARIVTVLDTWLAGSGGAAAVQTAVARPVDPLTTLRADNVPKSTTVPATSMSSRMGTPREGEPVASNTLTVIADCDWPSWVRRSGFDVMLIDWAKSDGPVSSGAGSD
jgi:hypothetical protein